MKSLGFYILSNINTYIYPIINWYSVIHFVLFTCIRIRDIMYILINKGGKDDRIKNDNK